MCNRLPKTTYRYRNRDDTKKSPMIEIYHHRFLQEDYEDVGPRSRRFSTLKKMNKKQKDPKCVSFFENYNRIFEL